MSECGDQGVRGGGQVRERWGFEDFENGQVWVCGWMWQGEHSEVSSWEVGWGCLWNLQA